jgi:chorismate mutase
MSQINKLRQDIEKLHEDLLKLILKRKDLVDQIWQLKRDHQLDMTDMNREQALIEQFDQTPELKNDPALRDFYHNVVKNIIAENKKYAKKP